MSTDDFTQQYQTPMATSHLERADAILFAVLSGSAHELLRFRLGEPTIQHGNTLRTKASSSFSILCCFFMLAAATGLLACSKVSPGFTLILPSAFKHTAVVSHFLRARPALLRAKHENRSTLETQIRPLFQQRQRQYHSDVDGKRGRCT